MRNCSINDVKNTIKNLYKLADIDGQYVSAFIWGPPGIGKSAGVAQAAQELGIGFIDLRMAQMNPVDFRGLPTINREEKSATWFTPDFFPTKGKGIMFLDEFNQAATSVMNAGFQLILDRRIGDYAVPAGWIIVAAGNRAEDSATVSKMPAPLANRFIHLQVQAPDDVEWRQWAIGAGISEQIVAFIGKMPNKLYVAPAIDEKTFPSPRSWTFASNLMKIGESVDAAVGPAIGAEFRTFCKVYEKIPDIDMIIAGKDVKIPGMKDVDILWATCMALLYRAKPEKQVWTNVFKFLEQIPKEFQTLMIQLFYAKSPEWKKVVLSSKEFDTFFEKNKQLFEGYE